MVGTVHSVGHLLNLLITGYFSDKYGRRSVLIFSALGAATFGIIRTFAWDYLSFTILEFIDAFLGAGVYTAGFILALEIVKPEHREISGAFAFCAKSFMRQSPPRHIGHDISRMENNAATEFIIFIHHRNLFLVVAGKFSLAVVKRMISGGG